MPALGSQSVRVLSLTALCLGAFLIILDSNVLNVALPTIGRDLHGHIDSLQWVVNSYTLVFAAFLLTAGGVGDRLGTKGLFLLGVALFTIASVLCGFSPNLDTLIGSRMLQGLGAACLAPGSLSLIAHSYRDPGERAKAIGIWAGTSGIAFAVGPIVGGVLVEVAGWRSIFFLNLPFGITVFVLTAFFVSRKLRGGTGGIDLPGQVLAIISLLSLTYVLTEGSHLGWSSAPTGSIFGLCLLTTGLFLFRERRIHDPLLPTALFSSTYFSIGNLVGLFYNFGLYGMLFALSLFLQDILKFSAVLTGLAFLPLTVSGALTSALVSGRLASRYGPGPPLAIGLSSSLIGSIILSAVGVHTRYIVMATGLFFFGFGTGMMAPAMTAAVLSETPTEKSGIASAVLNASRQVGGALGVAVVGVLLNGHNFVIMMHIALVIVALLFLIGIGLTLMFLRFPPHGRDSNPHIVGIDKSYR